MFLIRGSTRKQLAKKKFQEIGSMLLLKVLETTVSNVFQVTNTSSSSGNDVDADDVDIKPVYDEEPMAEVQLTVECNVFATRQQHTEQPEFNNEGEVNQNAEQCHDKRPFPAQLNDNEITELSYQYLASKNICLKKTIA
ncbi:hypothetical protein Tco_1503429 [Tanacetum coccineum]